MTRKAFNADLAAAQGTSFTNIRNISSIGDGEFTFDFRTADESFLVTVMIPEVSEYPKSHQVMTFAADEAPAWVAHLLNDTPRLSGKTVSQILAILSKSLARVEDDDDKMDLDVKEEQSSDEELEFEDEGSGDNGSPGPGYGSLTNTANAELSLSARMLAALLRDDMKAAKAAGFKVGHVSPLRESGKCILVVSCRVSKLGISEEALDAWLVNIDDYLVLLFRYPKGYKSMRELIQGNHHATFPNVELRTGLCQRYKPNQEEVVNAFDQKQSEDRVHGAGGTDQKLRDTDGFRPTFISRSLDGLLNTRLLPILNSRLAFGMSWQRAEDYYNQSQGAFKPSVAVPSGDDRIAEGPNLALPAIVTQDELSGYSGTVLNKSFPLVAMQFLLRHFVRCTEFCLVCHTRIETNIGAIKPYVCSKPLCLFQYMSLGFGFSLEPEILSQPYVVDLLVNFCYMAAKSNGLRSYPQGLTMHVPNPEKPINGLRPMLLDTNEKIELHKLPQNFGAIGRFSITEKLLEVAESRKEGEFREGDWLVINPIGYSFSWHCRIHQSRRWPRCLVDLPIVIGTFPQELDLSDKFVDVCFHKYRENFDTMQPGYRDSTIILLLKLLPSVKDMADVLNLKPRTTLAHCRSRMPPASLALLRWIVASNRSCIMQVDSPGSETTEPSVVKGEERIQGMNGWMQFRFAMGAPDKEQRFVNAVHQRSANGGSAHPTMFAWHGSPMKNWHSIIREGLDFNQIHHGRAYGHGVYHSLQYTTSIGYSGTRDNNPRPGTSERPVDCWPNSALKFDCCIALSEIVNAPEEFISASPHYVVQYLDWIQTRYLFVRPWGAVRLVPEGKPSEILPQEAKRTALGCTGQPLVLPVTALPKSRRPKRPSARDVSLGLSKTTSREASFAPKRTPFWRSLGSSSKAVESQGDGADDGSASDDTEPEDIEFLLDCSQTTVATGSAAKESGTIAKKPSEPILPYSPGPVHGATLLAPPAFASPAASKSLQRDFRTLLAVQQAHIDADTLSELGWYTDPVHMSVTGNLYQWVVCLHSFPMSLPLARDMKERGIDKVVLEMRFPADYPHSPPFLRVVTPRFLSFQQGGGGHVTVGGSICMELLTNSGWSAVSSIESVLLQVRMAIMNREPIPARLAADKRAYGAGEAVEAYKRVANAHGWKIPAGIDATARAYEQPPM